MAGEKSGLPFAEWQPSRERSGLSSTERPLGKGRQKERAESAELLAGI
jgi:hypothetical protein